METNELQPGAQLLERPRAWKLLAPFLITAAFLGWLLHGMDWVALRATINHVQTLPMLLSLALLGAAIFFADTLAFGLAYRVYLTHAVRWAELAALRGGMLLVQVGFPPLAEVLPPSFFFRRWKISPLSTLGAALVVLTCDFAANLTVLSAGMLLSDRSLGTGWNWFIGGSWLLVAAIAGRWFWVGRREQVRWILAMLLIRGILCLTNIAASWILLDAMGLRLSFAQTIALIEFMMMGAMLPISAGGYGGPQGMAIFFLVNLYQATTQEAALAFSLLWSTIFAIGRLTVGLACALPLWNLFQDQKP